MKALIYFAAGCLVLGVIHETSAKSLFQKVVAVADPRRHLPSNDNPVPTPGVPVEVITETVGPDVAEPIVAVKEIEATAKDPVVSRGADDGESFATDAVGSGALVHDLTAAGGSEPTTSLEESDDGDQPSDDESDGDEDEELEEEIADAKEDERNLPGITITQSGSRATEAADASEAELNARGAEYNETSRTRTDPPSEAHNHGAVDFSSKGETEEQRHADAKAISGRLGNRGTVVVEEVYRPAPGAEGPSAQRNTAYKNGERGRQRLGEDRATATHTHVQIDRDCRGANGAGRISP